jgi:hypothetical protein
MGILVSLLLARGPRQYICILPLEEPEPEMRVCPRRASRLEPPCDFTDRILDDAAGVAP